MVSYEHMNAADALTRIAELRSVYLAVFSLPPYNEGPEMVDKFVD